MPEFLDLYPPDRARAIWLDSLQPDVKAEHVALRQALGRVTAAAVVAQEYLPAFSRSSVDGYAVRAEQTYGASDSLPVYLSLQGEILMGARPGFNLDSGYCSLIHTGGMLPEGANAVVMLENTQMARSSEVEILKAVAIGENVIDAGEDVTPGVEVIPVGRRLRPAEIGGLAALGILWLAVAHKPRLGVISSGDEIVPPYIAPAPGQVRDCNSASLAALIEEAGGEAVDYGIVPDQEEVLLELARKAFLECDGLVISAGSSASARDLTAQVIRSLGEPGVLVHGVNLRPGKPTILAVCDGKPVVGLPGNPVSALVVAHLFLRPLVEALLGIKIGHSAAVVTARLAINLPSQAGREDWVAVRLERSPNDIEPHYQATPVFGKSNLIFTLVRADGMLRIAPDVTGLSAGELVDVVLW